jgi:spore coat polysaccharide biosynthesis protein SpsF
MLAILQARMSSTRLPGKVMAPILGQPMIFRQIERLRRARGISRIIVATSTRDDDDVLAGYLAGIDVEVFRGDLGDVLERFHKALRAAGRPEHFLRLTADCPLTDPAVIDLCIARHLSSGADYTHNSHGWTYPKGLDVEVCRTEVLDTAWWHATSPYEREHVTPFIYSRPERFRIQQVTRDPPLRYRWTVDTPEDFAFAADVYTALYPKTPGFTTEDILAWQAQHPHRVLMNAVEGL